MRQRVLFCRTSISVRQNLPTFGKPNIRKFWRESNRRNLKRRIIKITKYGAVADGKTLATDAIKKAIEECHKKGGGRVVVPAGAFLTGAVHLKSNVNLYLEKGATLKFSMNPKDYLPIVHTRWEGMELMHLSPFIYAYEQTNIAITGEGTLDGQGKSFFWKWHGNPRYGGDPNVFSQKPDRAANFMK